MSRVHEALKRAAEEAGKAADALVLRPDESDAPFMSPWEFEEAMGARPSSVRRMPALAAKLKTTPVQAPRPVPAADVPEDATPRPILTSVVNSSGSTNPAPPAAAAVRLESLLAMKWPQPFAPDVTEKLVVSASANPAAVEQYRRLAEHLMGLQRERGTKTVLVTSARAGEGKSLTVTNLALCLAEKGRRVLLVDANAPRPGIHRIFQVSAGRGLSAGLTGAIELTGGLALLPGGRGVADPAQAPDPATLRALVDAASAGYDWILIEAPATSQAPGVRGLAEIADATLLIASTAAGPAAEVEQAIDVIGRERVAGVVLNRVSPAH
jgi:protein-tyrosine kinase